MWYTCRGKCCRCMQLSRLPVGVHTYLHSSVLSRISIHSSPSGSSSGVMRRFVCDASCCVCTGLHRHSWALRLRLRVGTSFGLGYLLVIDGYLLRTTGGCWLRIAACAFRSLCLPPFHNIIIKTCWFRGVGFGFVVGCNVTVRFWMIVERQIMVRGWGETYFMYLYVRYQMCDM